MADIELVIKIPKEEYKRMKEFQMFGKVDVWKQAIKNGVMLPKNHGRLVDEKDLSLMTVYMIDGVLVCDAPTIIESEES